MSTKSTFFTATYRLLSLLTLCLLGSGSFVNAADVLISRHDPLPDPVSRGGEVTHSIDIENQLADIADDVVLTFPIPADTEFVSLDNPGECTHDGGTPGIVTCAYGDLLGTLATPPGPVKTVNIVVKAIGNTYDATASVTTTSVDSTPANNTELQNTTVVNGADLTANLSGTPDPVIAGGDITYTSTVSNNGPNDAVDSQVVYALPVNTTYINASASGVGWSCTYSSGNHELTCTLNSDLASGADAGQITFKTQVTGVSSGTLTGTSTVSATTLDPIPNNNVVTEDVSVSAGTDVSVTVMANPSLLIEGNSVVITLQPRNLGPATATNVEVVYTAPDGFTIDSAPPVNDWVCGIVLQVVTCTTASYTVGSSDDIAVNLTSPTPDPWVATHHNPVTITTDFEAPERLGNNSDTTPITLAHDGVDLTITKTKSPNPVAQGSNITSVIRVTNNGPLNALTGTITVTDTLDVTNEDYVSASGTNWGCSWSSPVVTCVYNAALNIGNTTTPITVVTTATSAMTLTNTASVAYSGTPGDYDSTNNSGSVSVTSTLAIADLEVTKTADTAILAVNENTITYTIDILNNGPDPASGITLTDSIPGYVSGSTVVVATPPGSYTCTTGSAITCTQNNGFSLANAATDSFTITVTRPLYDGVLDNTASAYSADVGDSNRNNNTDTATVTVDPVADLLVQSKTVTPNPVKAGVEATYVITVKNNGPSEAKGVSVVDTFALAGGDSGFTFISATPSSGSCSGLIADQSYISTDNPTLTCSMGDITNLGTRTISIVIRPNFMVGSPDRTIDNTVTATTTTFDNNTPNSFGPVTLNIEADTLDLLINNNDTPDPVPHNPTNGGDHEDNDVVYHVDYGNNGPSFASGISFDFTMTPKDGKTVGFRCDEASGGDACGTNADTCTISSGIDPVTGPASLTLTCTVGTLAAGNTGDRYLTFRVISEPDATGDTHATLATISGNELEIGYSNNIEAENTSVRGKVDLAIVKSASAATVDLTEPFNWTITVSNAGPSSSRNTILTDTLPADMLLFGAAPSWVNANDTTNGGCSINGQDLTCDFGTVSSGADVVLTIPVLINVWHGADISNCATVITDDVDVNSSNNSGICGSISVTNNYLSSDYGDAPDSAIGTGVTNYQTTLLDQGARHIFNVANNPYFGSCVDADGNGTLQNKDASDDDGTVGFGAATNVIGTCTNDDDEDGITIPVLVAGRNADLDITVSAFDCQVDAWIDYNADGDWLDAGEQIISNKTFAIGTNTETIAVPPGVTVGDSYARFRCSSGGGLAPTGSASDGEVEDYKVSLQPDYAVVHVDYGDAMGSGYGTTLADDGASHVLGVNGAPILGVCVDSDNGTLQNANADADDAAPQDGVGGGTTVGTCVVAGDDEDGVQFPSLLAGNDVDLSVTINGGTCRLDGWMDFNADGDWNDAGEQIVSNQALTVGTHAVTISIPLAITLGDTSSRFRCSRNGGLSPLGAAADGEVEDYRVSLQGLYSQSSKSVALHIDADADGIVTPNDTLRYTILIENTSRNAVTGVTFSDILPAEITYVANSVSASLGTPQYDGGTATISWSGDINAGAQLELTYDATVNVGAVTGTNICNQGAIIDDGQTTNTDGDFGNPGANATCVIVGGTPGGLAIKSVTDENGGNVEPGDILLYSIAFENTSTLTVNNMELVDNIPANTTLVANSITRPAASTLVTSDPVNIQDIDMPAGSQVTITFRVQIDNPLADGVISICNQGTVYYDSDGNGNNDATQMTDGDTGPGHPGDEPTCIAVVAGAIYGESSKNVTLHVDSDGDGHYTPGDILRYSVLIKNTGDQHATGVSFSDTLPAETTYVTGSVSASSGSVSENSGTISWSGDVESISQVSLTYDVIINAGIAIGVDICNQGTITDDGLQTDTDGDLVNPGDNPTCITINGSPAGLAIKSVTDENGGNIEPGEFLLYTITFQNTSTLAVADMELVDTIPANTTLVADSITLPPGATLISSDPIRIQGIDIAPKSQAITTFRVQLSYPLQTGVTQICNQGTVHYDSDNNASNDSSQLTDGDFDQSGNEPTCLPVVVTSGSISIEKSTNGLDGDTPPGRSIKIDAAVIWTYVVTNTGAVTLDNIAVTDNKEGAISCPKTSLAVNESMTCTATGISVLGQYANIGSVTATTPYSEQVEDSDPSHYKGNNFFWGLFTPAFTPRCPEVADYCYIVADGDNVESTNSALFRYTFKTESLELLNRLGVDDVETIVLSLDGKTLYAADNGVLGIIDPSAGKNNSFTVINPSGIGSGRGELGIIELNDIDGLAFDPTTEILYGSVRRHDYEGKSLDLIVQIDHNNGTVIKNAFAPGVDYIVITITDVNVGDVDDIAIDRNGTLFGIAGNSGGVSGIGGDHLGIINKQTGAVEKYWPLMNHGVPIQDMEGLTSYNTKVLYGTTGVEFVANVTDNTLYSIDKASGQTTPVVRLDQDFDGYIPEDFEAISCFPICK